jgi:hypothetical protein
MSCTTSLRVGQFASGLRLVAEAAFRRLTTPRGMLRGGEDEANYGFDLAGMIGTATTKNTAASLEGQIRAELLKDERISTVDVAVIDTTANKITSFAVTVRCTTAEGPFALQLAVSAVTVTLLGINIG